MRAKRILGAAFMVALSACKGECSCGASGEDDGSGGGSTTATTTTATTTGAGASTGEGAGGTSGVGGAGAGGDTTTVGPGGGSGVGGAGVGGSGVGGAGVGGAGVGGGQAVASPECVTADDCQLVNDCCVCDAIPTSQDPEACAVDCVQPTCSALALPQDAVVSCVAGRCVAGFACDWNQTVCDAAPPDCPDGQTASVIGGCYGPCVPTTECTSVTSCDQCDGGLGCVEEAGFGSTFHCVTTEPCAGTDCACLGPSVCDPVQDQCNDTADGVTCSCITC